MPSWSIMDSILIDQAIVHFLIHAPLTRYLIALKLDME